MSRSNEYYDVVVSSPSRENGCSGVSSPWCLDKPNDQLTPNTDNILSFRHGMTWWWWWCRHLKKDSDLQGTAARCGPAHLLHRQTPFLFVFLLNAIPPSSRRNLSHTHPSSLHRPWPRRPTREDSRGQRLYNNITANHASQSVQCFRGGGVVDETSFDSPQTLLPTSRYYPQPVLFRSTRRTSQAWLY
jgi:hypothetical protein